MYFAQPLYLLLLLLLIPAIVWYYFKQRNNEPTLQVSTTAPFEKMPHSYKYYLRHLRFVLRLAAISCLIVAIARPQRSNSWQNSSTEGIDIILALDVSTSMLARDFKPDRLAAAKDVAAAFINGRPNDNMGLVLFAGESFTLCPMTTDHPVLLNLMKDIQCGVIEDGTAIGMGLATAVNRIKDGQAKSKTIILLTDGSNNRGEIAPIMAADIAKTMGVRIYTVGVGTNGMASYPVQTQFGVKYMDMKVEIDENILKQIATVTDGKYFRAIDKTSLQKVFEEIDKLEKSKINVTEYNKKEEIYHIWAIWALILLLAEMSLRYTVLRNIP